MTDVKEENMDIVVNQPPLKKLKQARLPFKVISPKVGQSIELAIQTTPPSNKKRKLSDTAPGPNKASKTPRNDENLLKSKKTAPKVADAENEVSSSSEADINLKKCTVRIEKCKRSVIMDQFVRKPQQLEVSTTNLIDTSTVVDLTDSNDATGLGVVSELPDCLQAFKNEDVSCEKASDLCTKPCDTSDQQCDRINKEMKVPCDSTESKDDGQMRELAEKDTTEGDKVAAKSEDEATSSVNDAEETDKQQEDAIDDQNESLNETGESEKDLSTLSDSSHKSKDDSITEENEGTPGSAKNEKTTPSGISRGPKTPASNSRCKKMERAAEKSKMLQEKEKLKLEKQKEKEEKEKLRKEEKEKREKEKEEIKKKKEQERKEKVEQKEKERLDKLKQKEEERKKKEDEKQKKQEEKQKEVEEKQRQKEKEKEESKSKISEKQVTLFSSFFTKKEKDSTTAEEEQVSGNFIQFQVKSDMKLAPKLRRKPVDGESKPGFDALMAEQNMESLYLKQLKKDDYKPGKGSKTWPSSENDVILMDENDKPQSKFMKAKFLSFRENYRPAYRGTWNKKSSVINPRNPLAQDKALLDYEVDSDEEWEEEEPGESVSDSDGEGEEEAATGGPGDEEDEEDGFFVPHGYLSEGEGCEDDDEDLTPERMKVRQLARAKAFEVDMKKKTEVLKPVFIGCCWWTPDQEATPALDVLKKYQAVGFSSFPINLKCNKVQKAKKKAVKEDKKKLQPQNVPEEAIPDLIRLVHGNQWSVQKLIREFREYWRIKCSGADVLSQAQPGMVEKGPNDEEDADTSQNEDVGDDIKYTMSKRQVDKMIKEIAVYEKRNVYPKSCWYVHDAMLDKKNLKDLSVPTQWVWVTKNPNKTQRTATPNVVAMATIERSPTPTQNVQKEGSIMKFAKPGISPKFPVISPKPIPSACSTPSAQGKVVNKLKQETPKRDSLQQRISPAALFLPIDLAEVSSSDCAIVGEEAPCALKPDKNQPTLKSLFKASSVSTSSAKPSSGEVVVKDRVKNNTKNHISVKNRDPSSYKNEIYSVAKTSSIIGHLSQEEIVLGSAECPMEID